MGCDSIGPPEQLDEINGRIVACTICSRLVEYRERVARTKRRMYRDADYWGRPLPGFGDPRARLLLVGLAPAAHGGNRTGRMFTGDRSGDWLYGALHKFGFANQPASKHRDDGLSLNDAYVTAAIRCAPPSNKPLRDELLSCRPYLLAELASLTRLEVVVALGRIAFDSYLAAHRVFLGADAPALPKPAFSHGGVQPLPGGVTLVSSYHPSQQNTQTGRLTAEMFHSVFATVRRLLDTGIRQG